MDDFEEDPRVSILLSPDAYEIVMPLFNNKFDSITSFIGVDTFNLYDRAKIRHNEELSLLSVRMMKLSDWDSIVSWFCVYPDQSNKFSSRAVSWMIGTAEKIRSLGYENNSVIGIDDVNVAILDGDAT